MRMITYVDECTVERSGHIANAKRDDRTAHQKQCHILCTYTYTIQHESHTHIHTRMRYVCMCYSKLYNKPYQIRLALCAAARIQCISLCRARAQLLLCDSETQGRQYDEQYQLTE